MPARLFYRVPLAAYVQFLTCDSGKAQAQMPVFPASGRGGQRGLDLGKTVIKSPGTQAAIPKSIPESTEKRERTRARVGGDARPNQGTAAARWAGGTTKPQAPDAELSAEGIWFRPESERDEDALRRIRQFEPEAIAAAVSEASTESPQAWPTQVLRVLLRMSKAARRASRPEHVPVPAAPQLTPAEKAATDAARLAAAAQFEKIKKKMVVWK